MANTPVQSDDSVRHLKASESVAAAFHALGFPNPPPGLAAVVADQVRAATQSIPVRELANMSPGSGALGIAASSSVGVTLAMLTDKQLEAMKAGKPVDLPPAQLDEMRRSLAMRDASSSARFTGGGMVSGVTPRDTAMEATKALAMKELGSWAANNHALISISGAIELLVKMKFEEKSYRALKDDAGYSDRDVVAFVKAAKERGLSPKETNDLAKSQGEVAKGLPPEEQRALREAQKKWLEATEPAEQAKARKAFEDKLDGTVAKHPEKTQAVEEYKRRMREIDEAQAKRTVEQNATASKNTRADSKEANANALDAEAEALLRGGAAPEAKPADKAKAELPKPSVKVAAAAPGNS